MTRNGKRTNADPSPSGRPDVNRPDDEVIEPAPESPLLIHRAGTFPVTGHDVAFSTEEGEELSGRIQLRLSWDTAASSADIVIHLAAFLVNEDSKVPAGNPFYCVNHDHDFSKDGSTTRQGRHRHGHKVTEETIVVDLDRVEEDIEKIVFVAYIQDANPLKHTFSALVGGCVDFLQLRDGDGEGITKPFEQHRLDADYYDEETAVVMGEVFREAAGSWAYRNIGDGRSGLIEIGADYGVIFVDRR